MRKVYPKLNLPPPRIPVQKVYKEEWTKDIRCRFSNELENRLLVFSEDTKKQYEAWHTWVARLANNQCYWEGLDPDYLYGEFNFENDMPIIKHYMVKFNSALIGEQLYKAFEAHYPQKHRPDMRLKYIPNSEFTKDAWHFPEPYRATGFAKEYKTRYDMEMEAIYNILPGFSTPIPDWLAIYFKLKQLIFLYGKDFTVTLIRKFRIASILDLRDNIVPTEMLYHVDAACDFELRRFQETHPEVEIPDVNIVSRGMPQ